MKSIPERSEVDAMAGHCTHCGSPIEEHHSYCPSCGAQHVAGVARPRPAPRRGASSTLVAVGLIVAILFALLAIIMAGMVGVAFLRYRQSSPSPPAPPAPAVSYSTPESAQVEPDPARAEALAQEMAPDYVTKTTEIYGDGQAVEVIIGPPNSEFTDVLHFEWNEDLGDYELTNQAPMPELGE
jgi:hypothetical protein